MPSALAAAADNRTRTPTVVPTRARGRGSNASIVWVKTDTSRLVGSDRARIAGPTITIVSAVLPMMIIRLVNARLLRSAGGPAYAATRFANTSMPVITARIRTNPPRVNLR